ncbi:hypothetical protein Nepgr_030828 [Nepenthes gracilis]|uniref:Uncharacterized protein n=1 Tax=Nepenthes gracilis TaxID=150966 RepID=A0AAD3TFB4_NEPGR|nr:hypothetical protein Nepgr_030828 [Nepenthes gracilis]
MKRCTANQPAEDFDIYKDVGDLATHEKKVFCPILKRWHPLAAGAAADSLHDCYESVILPTGNQATGPYRTTMYIYKFHIPTGNLAFPNFD